MQSLQQLLLIIDDTQYSHKLSQLFVKKESSLQLTLDNFPTEFGCCFFKQCRLILFSFYMLINFIQLSIFYRFTMDVEQMILVAKKQLAAAFKMFDVDQSGYLQKNEFGQLIRRIAMAFHVQQPTFSDIDNLVAALDVNGDGKITLQQFQELIIQIVDIIKQEKQAINNDQREAK